RGRPLSRLVRQAQAGNHRLWYQMRILETGEVDEPGAVVHCPSEIRGGTYGEAGLAYTARSHQREEAGVSECSLHLGQQSAPADLPVAQTLGDQLRDLCLPLRQYPRSDRVWGPGSVLSGFAESEAHRHVAAHVFA